MKRVMFLLAALFLLAPHGASAAGNDDSDGACRKTGCNAAICADEDLFSICLAPTPAESCLAEVGQCERQPTGECGFTETPALLACLANIDRPQPRGCELETNAGCAAGEICQPGLCYMWCPAGDESCCAPSRCVPAPSLPTPR
jgi:hypothetical protein